MDIFNIKKVSSYLKRVENYGLKLHAHLLLKKNGVKRSQRKVIERRRERERLQTRDGERMRGQENGTEERREENYTGKMGGKLCSHTALHWNPSSFSSQPWDLRTSRLTSLSFGFLVYRDHRNSKLLQSPVVAVKQNNDTECLVLCLTRGKCSSISYHDDQHHFLLSHLTSTHETFRSFLPANTWVLLSGQFSSLTTWISQNSFDYKKHYPWLTSPPPHKEGASRGGILRSLT